MINFSFSVVHHVTGESMSLSQPTPQEIAEHECDMYSTPIDHLPPSASARLIAPIRKKGLIACVCVGVGLITVYTYISLFSHSHTFSYTPSRHYILTFSCATHSLHPHTHTHTHTLSLTHTHTHTLSLTHTLTLTHARTHTHTGVQLRIRSGSTNVHNIPENRELIKEGLLPTNGGVTIGGVTFDPSVVTEINEVLSGITKFKTELLQLHAVVSIGY